MMRLHREVPRRWEWPCATETPAFTPEVQSSEAPPTLRAGRCWEELIIADHSLTHSLPGGLATLTLGITQSRPPRHRLFGRMLLETHITPDSRQVIKLFRGHGFVIAPRSRRSGESRGIRRIQKSPDTGSTGIFFFFSGSADQRVR